MIANCLLILSVALASPDAMRGAELKNVRLGGGPAKKMLAFFRERMQCEFAQTEIFGEARRAFETRDDDIKGNCGGYWRGEFWGKLMLGTARAADYLQDPALLKFVREECHRLMALQDEDGYLGSYTHKENVAIFDIEKTRPIYGWGSCWNIWNRKYCMWGMLMAYKATGDREILDSVVRQMDQLIAMMRRLGLRLHDTGAKEMNGMPSMSILKPLLMLYRETGNVTYFEYAKEMLPDWDRDDGMAPNFFRNAFNGKPIADWYPTPQNWAKTYEMLSTLDGLVEYYRLTGERRILDTVVAIRDNILANEANPFGGIGYGDKLFNARNCLNALSEVCDAIHWIRLNLDLYEVTGDKRYLDTIETTYFNNFLAGVYRSGNYGSFFIRGSCRHENQYQCGFAYNHCCVNNVPRTFLDMAEGAVTVDRAGTYHVNFYQDATVTLDGVTISIEGDFPKGNVVTVRATGAKAPKVAFRQPGWCPKMDVSETAPGEWKLVFDMNPRLVERALPDEEYAHTNFEDDLNTNDPHFWMRKRYADVYMKRSRDVLTHFRRTAAATVEYGPLVLAKCKRVGDTEAQILDPFTVNGKGYSLAVRPIEATRTWCAFDVELTRPGEKPIRVKASDFQSAGDEPLGHFANAFSIWF